MKESAIRRTSLENLPGLAVAKREVVAARERLVAVVAVHAARELKPSHGNALLGHRVGEFEHQARFDLVDYQGVYLVVLLLNGPERPQKVLHWHTNEVVVDIVAEFYLLLDIVFRHTNRGCDARVVASGVVCRGQLAVVVVDIVGFLHNKVRRYVPAINVLLGEVLWCARLQAPPFFEADFGAAFKEFVVDECLLGVLVLVERISILARGLELPLRINEDIIFVLLWVAKYGLLVDVKSIFIPLLLFYSIKEVTWFDIGKFEGFQEKVLAGDLLLLQGLV